MSENHFSRGEPGHGAELADELERIVALHDASNIAALIVDPVSASGGVLVPPKGYLKRLREICTRHGILLVFDEVITGWGRLGAPFAAQHFGIEPDLITFAKGVTSGAVPLGGVIVKDSIYQAFTSATDARHRVLPRLHLFRPSARLRRRHRHAGSLRGREAF